MISEYQWLIVRTWKDSYKEGEAIKPEKEERFTSLEEMLTYLQDQEGKKVSVHGENCLLDWG